MLKLRFKMVTAIIMAISMISGIFFIQPVSAANFTWTLGSDVTASAFRYVDGTPGIVKDGNDIWMVYADGAVAGAPIRRYKGTNLDNLVQQPDGVKDSSFNQPHGDDVYWIMGGIWVDENGVWYSPVHVEFNYQGSGAGRTWFRRIGIATSNDKGATWHYWCDIITSNHSYSVDEGTSDYFNYGPGGQHIYVDTAGGYIYMYYGIAWCKKTGVAEQNTSIRVARSPISAKMNQGSWYKYYNGTWNEPGLGGKDSDINLVATNEQHVSYNTYLGKYIAIGGTWGHDHSGAIQTCTSLETQNWTTMEKFCDSSRIQWYNWSIDPTTYSMWTTGQTFRQYTSKCYVGGIDAKYMTVTLGTGSTSNTTFGPLYPAHSVKDFNSPWDWAFKTQPSFPNAFTQNFNSNLGGYSIVSGIGTLARESNQMSLQASGNGAALAIDNNSPSTADGIITAKITPQSNSRCGIVFRYQSPTQWVGLFYDTVTNWVICDGAGHYKNIPTDKPLTNGTQYTVQIEFRGTFYAINVDGVCIYCDSFSAAQTASGKIGVRNWYYSQAHYDDIVLNY